MVADMLARPYNFLPLASAIAKCTSFLESTFGEKISVLVGAKMANALRSLKSAEVESESSHAPPEKAGAEPEPAATAPKTAAKTKAKPGGRGRGRGRGAGK